VATTPETIPYLPALCVDLHLPVSILSPMLQPVDRQ
jgi:hypothetical protein